MLLLLAAPLLPALLAAPGDPGAAREGGWPGGAGQAVRLKLSGCTPVLALPAVATPPQRPWLLLQLNVLRFEKLRTKVLSAGHGCSC